MSAYLKFFQLEKSPFDTTAQSALVLGTKALRTAYAEIEKGLADGAPRICVDGKAGLGKTSLARALPKLLSETARVVLILNPSLSWSTLRSAIVKQLDLAEGNLSRKTLVRARAEGRRLVIAIDQAERISNESLDHLDILLGYKNDDDEQLLHCVLLTNLQAAASHHNEQGEQTPLLWWLDKLNTLQLEFQPIPVTGVTSYVQKHLKRAGWKGGQIFTPDALQTIHRLTGGVPREMSDLCERALELAGQEETDCIDAGIVEDVFGEIPLDEIVDEEGDVTDSAFIGPKDDHASATTATFGGGAAREDVEPRAFDTMPAAADQTDSAASMPGDDDPRIDRMPTPGRTVHAPVAAPISMDSFFGDSPSGPVPATTPAAPATTIEAEPRDIEEEDEATEATGRRGAALKWIGIAAGALLVLGGGGFAALTMLGGDSMTTDSKPPVIARPKANPTAAPAPIAGIEAVDPLEADEGAVAAVPGAELAGTADAVDSAARPVLDDAPGTATAGTAMDTDPLLGFEGVGADPLDPGPPANAAEEIAEQAVLRAEPGSASSGAAAADTAVVDAQPEIAPAAAAETAPAAPAPAAENPADAEIDAPFW